jgi:phage shock protein C
MNCPHCQREIADYSNFCYFCGAAQRVGASPTGAPKRFMRSLTDTKVAGVCGGIAEYMDADSTVIRLIWALLTLFTGIFFGVLAYLIAWLVMPLAPTYIPAPAAAPSAAQPSPRTT